MDKILHFGVCLLLTLVIGYFSLPLAFLAVLVTGVGKEVYDYLDYGLFSIGDLIADILGFIIGLSIYLII